MISAQRKGHLALGTVARGTKVELLHRIYFDMAFSLFPIARAWTIANIATDVRGFTVNRGASKITEFKIPLMIK
jgi:hypothetical protein